MGKLIIGANGQELAPGIVKIAYHTPAGTLDISSNGVYDVAQYSLADVQVPQPTGTFEIIDNGIYDISSYASVDVQVPQPTGTLEISINGIYDISSYASVDVQVTSSGPQYYIEKTIVNGVFQTGSHLSDFSSVTHFGSRSMAYAYIQSPIAGTLDLSSATVIDYGAFYMACYYCSSLQSVNLHSLTTINSNDSFYYAFYGCSSLQSIDLSSLVSITGDQSCYMMFCGSALQSIDLSSLTTISGSNSCASMFSGASLTSVDLSSLTTISGSNSCNQMFYGCPITGKLDLSSLTSISGYGSCGQMFVGCTGITEVDLSKLEEFLGSSNGMFQSCSNLTSVDLSSLRVINDFTLMFAYCTSLTTLSFPALISTSLTSSSMFHRMLLNVSGCTVHFPSNLQSIMSSWSDVINGFGGTNTIVLFDLPATS